MKKVLIIFTLSCLIISCSSTKKLSNQSTRKEKTRSASKYYEGSSYSNAIVINEYSMQEGVGAEYDWLRENYPNYKFQYKTLTYLMEKPYHIICIMTIDGLKRRIYFDISNFYR